MVLPARHPLSCHSARARLCKVPVRARSRSDNYAAVLRLQNTQPKDRRIYTAFTGILAGRQPVQDVPEQDGKGAAQGTSDY